MNILLTGANGFVGQHFTRYQNEQYVITTASVRSHSPLPAFSGIDAVVHLGGKAHEMKPLPDEVYFTSNAELTKQLALAAKSAGVPHFVYASSVKVYGNKVNTVVDENSVCEPDDAYGKSKLMAEQYLMQLADDNFTVSIIRPPLVYGPGVKGNMLKLLQLAGKQIPLPFGNIHNRRSMVYVRNLVALICTLLAQKKSGVFIAGDAAPLSTTRLAALLQMGLRGKKQLIPIPQPVQWLVKKLRNHLYIRLFGSFEIDNRNTNQKLSFVPPFSTEEGIRDMIQWYKTTAE